MLYVKIVCFPTWFLQHLSFYSYNFIRYLAGIFRAKTLYIESTAKRYRKFCKTMKEERVIGLF